MFAHRDAAQLASQTAESSANVTFTPRRQDPGQQLFETVHVHWLHEMVVKS